GPEPTGGRPPATENAAERPTVVATTNVIGSVLREGLGAHVDVIDVMPRVSDPHSFEVSAATTVEMAQADLVVANGLGLEAGLSPVLESIADEVNVIEIAPQLDPQTYGEVSTEAETGTADPHVWTDPSRMADVPALVVEALSADTTLDLDLDTLRGAADDAREALEALDSEVAGQLGELPPDRRQLVTSHHGLAYYADRYDLTVLGVVLPSGAALAAPSAADLADLTTALETADVDAIFADPTHPAPLAEALARERGGQVQIVDLPVESLGEDGSSADSYPDMIRTITERIVDALSA
ncbi:metal ABC transporter substrate-binding protein, partial [Euzebya tangerina]